MACGRGIGTVVDVFLLSTTDTDEAHHDVVAGRVDGVITQGDARSRSRLSGYGGVGADVDIAFQCDDSTNVEDYNLLVVAADGSTE